MNTELASPQENQGLQAAKEVVANVLEKFSWANEGIFGEGGLLVNLEDYSSELKIKQILQTLMDEGFIDNTVDMMAAVRVVVSNMVALRIADLTGKQVKRLQAVGTFAGNDAFVIKALSDALYKSNKTILEMENEAVFSKKSRTELSLVGNHGFQDLLDSITRASAVPLQQGMSSFLREPTVRVANDDEQIAVFEEIPQKKLSDTERQELIS